MNYHTVRQKQRISFRCFFGRVFFFLRGVGGVLTMDRRRQLSRWTKPHRMGLIVTAGRRMPPTPNEMCVCVHACACMHAHTLTFTHTYTPTHSYTHTHIHTHTLTLILTHTLTLTLTHTRTYTRTYTHSHTLTYTLTLTYAH